MLFNSIEFAVFFSSVFVLYWFITNKNLNSQNALLLIASYFFYGWWDWRFLFLLLSLSLFNFITGILIENGNTKRNIKIWLIIGIIVNLGVLVVFKYYNFFIDSFIDLVSFFGYNLPRTTTKIIIPLGISFFIFLSLSYLVDIFKKNINANRNIVEVLLTLSFFPIILAGPIQRPASLLPQIDNIRTFKYDQAVDGLRQILWGLFAKVVIADKLAFYADTIFNNYSEYGGSTLLLGVLFFAFQIYADFSGYSNIAIGIAKLLGFSLMQNFAYPYFSRDIAEFWKKWHISLTTWFRDYVFLPISISISWKIKKEKIFLIKTDQFIYIIASSITWILTGLWHGSNYTFIAWGIINGFFLIIYHLQKGPRKKLFKRNGIKNDNLVIVVFESLFTLIIIGIAWIFFRAESISHAVSYINGIFSQSLFSIPVHDLRNLSLGADILYTGILLLIFVIFEWIQKNKQHSLQFDDKKIKPILRWSIYYCIIFLIIYFHGNQQSFIYMKF
jgi:alginate O-acetyltransferase complex protein AlgI